MKKLLTILTFALLVAAPAATVLSPMTTSAITAADQAAADKKCEYRILGFPTWFRGLSKLDAGGNCGIVSPEELNTAAAGQASNGLQNFIWKIVLNVVEIGLFLAGYVALLVILYSGFMFLTGGSNPGQIEKARVGLINAVIGLTISMAAIAAVNLIFRLVG